MTVCAARHPFHRHSRVGGPFIGTRTMKNEVLLRYNRTRWHSVIGDSSIHRVAGENVTHVIADLIRNPEGKRLG